MNEICFSKTTPKKVKDILSEIDLFIRSFESAKNRKPPRVTLYPEQFSALVDSQKQKGFLCRNGAPIEVVQR